MRAMEKDRARRYQTMAEVERDLERLLAGDQNVGLRPPVTGRRARCPRAAPRGWPLVVAGLVVLAAASRGAPWPSRRPAAAVRPVAPPARRRARRRVGAAAGRFAPPPAPAAAPPLAPTPAPAAPRKPRTCAPSGTRPSRPSRRPTPRPATSVKTRRAPVGARERATRTSEPPAARLAVLVLAVCSRARAARRARAPTTPRPRRARTTRRGIKLFDAREHEQALIEFAKANEIKPRPAALFMMAQCEYLLGPAQGRARALPGLRDREPDGEFAVLARDRIESIDQAPEHVRHQHRARRRHRPHLARGRGRQGRSRPARRPTTSPIPRGRYRVDVTKPNYQGQTRIVDVDIARDQAALLQAGADPGAAGDRDDAAGRDAVRERQPRAEPVPAGRHARTHRDLRRGDRLRVARPSTSRWCRASARLLDRRRAAAAHVRAALGPPGAGRRVVAAGRPGRRGRGRRRHRRLAREPERRRRCCW